jgi:hypothetical protein
MSEENPMMLAAAVLMEKDIDCMLICYRKKNGDMTIDYDGGALMALGLAVMAQDMIKRDLRFTEDENG